MSERERHVNHSLHALDEAHRLGRLTRAEYRSRRRHLLSALRDSHVVTARNAIVRPAAQRDDYAPTVSNDVLHEMLSPRRAVWKWAVMLAVIGVVLGVGLWYWLSRAA